MFPVFFLVLVGVVDFSLNFSEGIQARNGTREATRQAIVDRTGGVSGCFLDGFSSGHTPTRETACLTKARLKLDPERTRVKIILTGKQGGWASAPSWDNSILICTMAQARSVTGLLGFAFDDKVHRNKVTIQIEKLGADPIQAGAENPLPGQDWTWCMPDNPGTYE